MIPRYNISEWFNHFKTILNVFYIYLKELKTNLGELSEISQYHFDGGGKYFRPLIIMLMARACNVDNRSVSKLSMNCFESFKFILYMKILNSN